MQGLGGDLGQGLLGMALPLTLLAALLGTAAPLAEDQSRLLLKSPRQLEQVFKVLSNSIEVITPKEIEDLALPTQDFDQHSEEHWISWHFQQDNLTRSFIWSPQDLQEGLEPLFRYVRYDRRVSGDDRTRVQVTCETMMRHPSWGESANRVNFVVPGSMKKDSENFFNFCPEVIINNATFLVVDYEALHGKMAFRTKRDYVVPYYAEHAGALSHPAVTAERSLLIFFCASPYGWVREKFIDKYVREVETKPADVFISIERMQGHVYLQRLSESTFCLQFPGHTVSSSRVFMAIKTGCIPVFISDLYFNVLPYRDLIDWAQISIVFNDILVHPQQVIDSLRQVSSEEIFRLRTNLIEAEKLLMVFSLNPSNPVTLLFATMLLERLDYCYRGWTEGRTTAFIPLETCKLLEARIRKFVSDDVVAAARELLSDAHGKLIPFSNRLPYVPYHYGSLPP